MSYKAINVRVGSLWTCPLFLKLVGFLLGLSPFGLGCFRAHLKYTFSCTVFEGCLLLAYKIFADGGHVSIEFIEFEVEIGSFPKPFQFLISELDFTIIFWGLIIAFVFDLVFLEDLSYGFRSRFGRHFID